MGILTTLKKLFAPKSYAETEFGMDDIPFFLALVRACPDGSRLTFHQGESASFVHAFREWSHRKKPQDFEADHYTIDRRFIAVAERLAAAGELQLDHHFTIVAPDDRLLCDSLDDCHTWRRHPTEHSRPCRLTSLWPRPVKRADR